MKQKNPGNLTVPGYLMLGHNVPYGTLYLDIFAVHAFDSATLHLGRAFAL